MDYVALLHQEGDPLEIAIVEQAGEELGNILIPYALVWDRYVRRQRLPGQNRVRQEWMQFAGNHYSAIIRVYNAWKTYRWLIHLCWNDHEHGIGARLLDLHAATSAFWWYLGSAVDNLGQVLEFVPDSKIDSRKGKAEICKDCSTLDYVYNRRTQFVHSRLVPIGIDSGFPNFSYDRIDAEHAASVPEYTDWDKRFGDPKDLDSFYKEKWQLIKKDLSKAWYNLIGFMERVSDPERIVSTTSADTGGRIMRGVEVVEMPKVDLSTLPDGFMIDMGSENYSQISCIQPPDPSGVDAYYELSGEPRRVTGKGSRTPGPDRPTTFGSSIPPSGV